MSKQDFVNKLKHTELELAIIEKIKDGKVKIGLDQAMEMAHLMRRATQSDADLARIVRDELWKEKDE